MKLKFFNHYLYLIIAGIVLPVLGLPQEVYYVKKGDTLSEIILKRNLLNIWRNGQLQKTIQANPHIENPDLIYPGDKITPPKQHKKQHPVTVIQGDTISEIVARNFNKRIYGKTGLLKEILKLNPHIKNPDKIYVNDKIYLPSYPAIPVPTVSKKDLTEEKIPPKIKKKEVADRISKKRATKRPQSLFIAPMLGFRRLDTYQDNGANGYIISNLGYGLLANWKLYWGDANKWETSISIRALRNKYIISSNKLLGNPDQLYAGLSFGGGYRYHRRTLLELKLGLDRDQTLQAKSSTEVEIKSIILPNVGLVHHWEFLKYKNLSGFWSVMGGTTIGTSINDFKTETGLYWVTGIGAKYPIKWGDLKADVHYRKLNIGISGATQRNQDLIFSFGLGIDL